MLPMAVSVLACLIHAPPGAEVPAGKVSPDALEISRLEMPREVFDSYDEIMPLVAQAYDRIYPPAEMQAICTFLRTPEGRMLALNRARVLKEFQAEMQAT
jgi:hypothetical protein